MTRPEKIREIYAELRVAFGNEQSAPELLGCANLILDALDEESTSDPVFRVSRQTIEEMPLFDVFEKKGWQLMCRDTVNQFDHENYQAINDMIANQFDSTDWRVCA